MKKLFFFLVIVSSATTVWSQQKTEDRNFRIPLIGEIAPSFTAESTSGVINFPEDYGRYWKVLFSHPQDFTPVCSSEILELANLQQEFDKLGTKLVVISTDPLDTHVQWKKALEELSFKGRTPVKIRFPLVDDEYLSVSKKYGMIHATSNSTKAVRGVFVIDPQNVVQAVYFYPEKVGRSTDELLRTVTALQTVQKDYVLTPADWRAGSDVLIPFVPKSNEKKETGVLADVNQVSWFMTYKKLEK